MHRRARLPAALVGLTLAVGACSAGPPGTPSTTGSVHGPPSSMTVASPIPSPEPAASARATAAELPQDELLTFQLVDVRTGEHFTLGQLAADGPVLVEPMAVWCTNCRAQMHEVSRAHQDARFLSVSLGVDLSETGQDLAAYADREGWDWRFAMAGPDLYRLLQRRFGDAATYPPATPLIVIGRDGTVRPLEFGVGTRSADQLVAELQAT